MDDVLELQKIAYEESDELCWSTNSDCNIGSCNAQFDLFPQSYEE